IASDAASGAAANAVPASSAPGGPVGAPRRAAITTPNTAPAMTSAPVAIQGARLRLGAGTAETTPALPPSVVDDTGRAANAPDGIAGMLAEASPDSCAAWSSAAISAAH